MKRKIVTSILAVMLAASLLPLRTAHGVEGQPFKVMGYFCESPSMTDPVDTVQFDGLTHLIYGFLKPASDGSLYPIGKPERLKELVETSHAHGVNVVIAVGGVYYGKERLSGHFEALAGREDSLQRFVQEVTEFVETYQLDGVEIDWEYPRDQSSEEFERLILALKDALSPRGKTLSAALAGAASANTKAETVRSVTERALDNLDWINLMAYDLGGGQHSPYWFADVSIQYWKKRGVSQDRIVLGIPLYARPSWKQYRHLVAADPENAYRDYAPDDSYYNGLNTIRQKTRLAWNKAGGIMFFDIQEDTHDETSGLRAALETIHRADLHGLADDCLIVVDGRELRFAPEEKMGAPYRDEQHRIQIPVRKALEAIGADIEYDHASRTITATLGETAVKMQIGSAIVEVNGVQQTMDTVALLKEGVTYVPVRWLYESFGYEVTWSDSSQTILVSKSGYGSAKRA